MYIWEDNTLSGCSSSLQFWCRMPRRMMSTLCRLSLRVSTRKRSVSTLASSVLHQFWCTTDNRHAAWCSTSQVKVPVLAMRGGTDLQTYVDILVPSSAKLTLIKVFSWMNQVGGQWPLLVLCPIPGWRPGPPDWLPLHRLLCQHGWRGWPGGWGRGDGGGWSNLLLLLASSIMKDL